ncbi:MAG TPA: YHS domain-containing protein [Vicinamibacterales bacterium]|nr:YHS domain-containing protein [Vicinamibacterales bacterium]
MTVLAISTLCVSLLAASSTATLAAAPGDIQDTKATTTAPAQERDPICGMSVDAAKAKAAGRTTQYEGKTYYFCNDSCKKQFDSDPAKYAAQAKEKTQASDGDGCCCGCCGGNGGMAAGAMAGGKMTGGGMCGRRMR